LEGYVSRLEKAGDLGRRLSGDSGRLIVDRIGFEIGAVTKTRNVSDIKRIGL
jgi:hypothetical protein